MPVHIRRIAKQRRSDRREIEAADTRRRELESYRARAGPLHDRAEQVQALVRDIRTVLPESNVETLHPRREHWRREYQAFQRQAQAEPNPHYRPVPGHDPSDDPAQAQAPAHGGMAWWQDDSEREADSCRLLSTVGRLPRPRAHQRDEKAS